MLHFGQTLHNNIVCTTVRNVCLVRRVLDQKVGWLADKLLGPEDNVSLERFHCTKHPLAPYLVKLYLCDLPSCLVNKIGDYNYARVYYTVSRSFERAEWCYGHV